MYRYLSLAYRLGSFHIASRYKRFNTVSNIDTPIAIKNSDVSPIKPTFLLKVKVLGIHLQVISPSDTIQKKRRFAPFLNNSIKDDVLERRNRLQFLADPSFAL